MGKEGKEQDEKGKSRIGNIKNEKKEEKNNKEMRGLEHSAENGKEERRQMKIGEKKLKERL